MSKKLQDKLDKITFKLHNRDDSVIEDINKELIEIKQDKDKSFEVQLLGHNAVYNRIKVAYDAAHLVLDKADKILKENPSIRPNISSWIFKIRSSIYFSAGNFEKSDKYYFKALEINEKHGLKESAAKVMLDISQSYLARNKNEKAAYYLNKSLKYFLEIDPNYSDWVVYLQLGNINFEANKLEEAFTNFKIVLKNAKKANSSIGEVYALERIASYNLKKLNYKEGIKFANDAITISEKNNTHIIIGNAKLIKIECLLKMNNVQNALKVLNNTDLSNIPEYGLVKVYEVFSEVYEAVEDYKNSLLYVRKLLKIKEKLENIEAKKHAEEIESKFQNKLKEREKEILRLQKVEMEQKALRAQLNPHFFFNSLNSINKFITDNDAKNASKFLFQFSSLMRKTLENSEESFITIEDEVAYLKDYLALEQLRFDFSFNFEIKVTQEIEDDFVKIPTMMIQPYVENCIKHGINGVENGLIKIVFKGEGKDKILCTIEDNGNGRSERLSKHKSMGTVILQNRLKILKEEFKLDCSVQIVDLYDKNKKQNGTKVDLLLTV